MVSDGAHADRISPWRAHVLQDSFSYLRCRSARSDMTWAAHKHKNTKPNPSRQLVTPGSLARRSGSSHWVCEKRLPGAHGNSCFCIIALEFSPCLAGIVRNNCEHEAWTKKDQKVGFFSMSGFWIKEIREIYCLCTWIMNIHTGHHTEKP